MDIKEKLKPEDRQELKNLLIETQVLENLLKERRKLTSTKIGQLLNQAGLKPEFYNLKVNTMADTWESTLKEDVLTIPGNPNMVGRVN